MAVDDANEALRLSAHAARERGVRRGTGGVRAGSEARSPLGEEGLRDAGHGERLGLVEDVERVVDDLGCGEGL